MAKSPWSFKTALEVSAALKARKVSAVELAEDAIGRIERHDGRINAVCVRDFSRALDAAREADTALARGETRPLLGIPLTVKESFNVAGLPTTWGLPAQKDFVPKQDALAIVRVKEAGGVILGKTNVPFRLGDLQSYNDIYGTTNNPYNLGRTPGGSSGGSAAALAELGPVSQQTLTDLFAVYRSTMVGFVDELERKGHVRRGKNPSDRRAYALELTPSGAKVERKAAELLAGCERHYLEPLSAAERRQLLELLGRLVARDFARTGREGER